MTTQEYTYPLSLPAAPNFRQSRFGLRRAVADTRSPFTFQRQVQRHQGAIWVAELSLPPMKRVLAAKWQAFGLKLQGTYGTFLLGDPDAPTPQGAGGGTPVVNGASQTGNQLATDGWPATTTVLKEGDYFSISNALYMVVNDATSDTGGAVTIDFEPAIVTAPADGASLTITNPKGTFALASSEYEWDANALSVYGISFSAISVPPGT